MNRAERRHQASMAKKRSSVAGRAAKNRRRFAIHANFESEVRAAIQADIASLQLDAGIHLWAGDNATKAIDLSRRLAILALGAGTLAYIDEHEPDMRIVRGMSNSLDDYCCGHGDFDHHRAAIQSGLGAISRILPRCDDFLIARVASDLDTGVLAELGVKK